MRRGLIAGAVSFAAVFAAGFFLGTLRLLVLAPALGETTAVLLELPAMLLWSWVVTGAAIRHYAVPRAGAAGMAAASFGLLVGAEVALGLATGGTLAAIMAGWATAPGALGLGAQVLYGLMPFLRLRG